MARHLWAFCVALATAAQPQNATRQLDAYEPPPTDLSRACASYCENCYKAPVASSLCRRTYAATATKLDDGIELKLVPEDPDDGIGGGVIRWVLNDLGTGKHAPPPKPRGYVACRGALSEAFMDGALATHLPWSGLQAA